jgi:hypothetical protein
VIFYQMEDNPEILLYVDTVHTVGGQQLRDSADDKTSTKSAPHVKGSLDVASQGTIDGCLFRMSLYKIRCLTTRLSVF